MPKSKSRKKKSNGKAWRTGRVGSEYDDNSDAGVPEPDYTSPADMLLADALMAAFIENEVYGDEKLGRILIRRGWEPIHVHFENLSDTWAWPPSATGEGWVHTTVTVEEFGYAVDYASTEETSDDVVEEFSSREELLEVIEVIEAYRHPDDARP
ncbi:MAG: hypothetical protein WBB07_11635 [Mycobacterium sp.]